MCPSRLDPTSKKWVNMNVSKKLISIEYEIPGFSDCHHEYLSDQSLLDADLILFEPEEFDTEYGKPEFDESDSLPLMESTRHWHSELSMALECGKTVFLILKKRQSGGWPILAQQGWGL
jgi:hypothetical protein